MFRLSTGLFVIRQFLKEVPAASRLVFNTRLRKLVYELFGEDYFVVKSIYFDKPHGSNWYVQYHQDLTISVDKKKELPGFGPWSVKQRQFAVQPPLNILQDIFTARIHLDDTDAGNGALKVIPGSHAKGICRPGTIDWTRETEEIATVSKGGVMIMKPLLLHSSSRTTSNRSRRVIHIEFARVTLPEDITWSEK